ncbi:MAG TPA: hypothetical protein VLF71_01775 [Candidatus Saccharimonadales bacterium]|nr:hypothetical protein [Candidatus Saccharimonadales bacterium]
MDEGIERVAEKFAARYIDGPYAEFEDSWQRWQGIVRGFSTLSRYKGRNYWLDPRLVYVEVERPNGRPPIYAAAQISIQGTLEHTRKAQRALSILEQQQRADVSQLAGGAALWEIVEANTSSYAVGIKPFRPGLLSQVVEISRLSPPTHNHWADGLDDIGPSIFPFYAEAAEDATQTVDDLNRLLDPQSPRPGPDMGQFGSPEAGIQM